MHERSPNAMAFVGRSVEPPRAASASIFWPRSASRSASGFIVGWNPHSFMCSVATIATGVSLDALEAALAELARDPRMRLLLRYCGGPPTVLGVWRHPDDAGQRAPVQRAQTAELWLSMVAEPAERGKDAHLPALREVFCCGCRYRTALQLTLFERGAVVLDANEQPAGGAVTAARLPTALGYVARHMGCGDYVIDALHAALRAPAAPPASPSTSSAKDDDDVGAGLAVDQVSEMDATPTTEDEDDFIASALTRAVAHGPQLRGACGVQRRRPRVAAMLLLPLLPLLLIAVLLRAAAALLLLLLRAPLLPSSLPLPRTADAAPGTARRRGCLARLSLAARLLESRLCRWVAWPHEWDAARRAPSWHPATRRRRVELASRLCTWAVDLAAGAALAWWLLRGVVVVGDGSVGGAVDGGMAAVGTQLAEADRALQRFVAWLTGPEPGGFKLNENLNVALGGVLLRLLRLWHGLLRLVWTRLAATLGGGGAGAAAVRVALTLPCGFGGCLVVTALSEAVAVALLHVNFYHRALHVVYTYYVAALASLYRLFRGRKFNVLRRRTDSCAYDLEQQLLGTLLFTLLCFLFPTVLAYYLLAFALRCGALALQHALLGCRTLLERLPLLPLLLRLLRPSLLGPDTPRFAPLRAATAAAAAVAAAAAATASAASPLASTPPNGAGVGSSGGPQKRPGHRRSGSSPTVSPHGYSPSHRRSGSEELPRSFRLPGAGFGASLGSGGAGSGGGGARAYFELCRQPPSLSPFFEAQRADAATAPSEEEGGPSVEDFCRLLREWLAPLVLTAY